MLASSSHMKRAGDLGGDLQNFGQCLTRKAPTERLVDVVKRHTASQAFENKGDSETGATNCQLPAEKLGIGYDPLILLICCWLPTRHEFPQFRL